MNDKLVLTIVMHGDKSPVGDNTRNANGVGIVGCRSRTSNQVFDSRGVEQLDVGEVQDLAHQRRREKSSVLNDDEVTFILVWHTNLVQEQFSRLAHDHSAKELTAEPGATTRSDAGLDHSNLKVGTLRGQSVRSTETTGSSTDDDNIRLGVGVQVVKVTTGHSTGDLRLTNRGKGELLPVVLDLGQGLGHAMGSGFDSEILFEAQAIASARDWNVKGGGGGRHAEVCSGS
jgi:hypothetical protein